MKSERHIAGLKYLKEKIKSGEMNNSKKQEIVKQEDAIKDIEPIIQDELKIDKEPEPKVEQIKQNIKKLLSYKEDIKIPKVNIL